MLKQDNFLEDAEDIDFVSKKISFYLSEINVIHPFREGNGRTQRIYCQQLCKNTGKFYLDFSMASENEMLEAIKLDKLDSFIKSVIPVEANENVIGLCKIVVDE